MTPGAGALLPLVMPANALLNESRPPEPANSVAARGESKGLRSEPAVLHAGLRSPHRGEAAAPARNSVRRPALARREGAMNQAAGRSGGRIPVVGIGASAGGIEAFRGFFENMGADSGLGFVVVLHLPSDRKSILPEILGRWTPMRIVEATDQCPVEANCVYVPPPGVVVTVEGGCLHLHQLHTDEPRELNPITMLFNSLAVSLQEDAIGVVLSGTGNDGALGLKAIKEKGGLTLVQGPDGKGPQHDGMPNSAIATGAVDIIAPVEAIPGHIIAVQRARRVPNGLEALSEERLNAARLAICGVLNRQTGHDFSGYKDKTFLRRVQRRMEVLGLSSLQAFVDRLEHDRHEAVMLFRDLLIGVTSFFRDEETFEILKEDRDPAAVCRQVRGFRDPGLGAGLRDRGGGVFRWRCCCASMPTPLGWRRRRSNCLRPTSMSRRSRPPGRGGIPRRCCRVSRPSGSRGFSSEGSTGATRSPSRSASFAHSRRTA